MLSLKLFLSFLLFLIIVTESTRSAHGAPVNHLDADYIIVGGKLIEFSRFCRGSDTLKLTEINITGGLSGLVVASRLSEDYSTTVTIIEDGSE